MRKQPGTFTFHRRDEDEVYRLEIATFRATRQHEGYELFFYAKAKKGAIQSSPATAEFPTTPNAEVFVFVADFDPKKLVGQRFTVPAGYAEDIEDHVATVYYYSHQDLNANKLEVLAREGKSFHVRWTATTGDVDHYDGSVPDNRVVIDGWFMFEGIKDAE
jgi:hypothetical protein